MPPRNRLIRHRAPARDSGITYPEDVLENGAIRLFVYGTLRPGHGLHRTIRGSVVGEVFATAWGYRLFNVVNSTVPVYPVMTRAEGHVTIGDLLWVLPTPAIEATVAMERGAGYLDEVITCNVSLDGRNHTVKALAFIWPALHDNGWAIPENNWDKAWNRSSLPGDHIIDPGRHFS